MQLALIENQHREDLTPVEEAEGFQRLIAEFGLTQAEVAEVAGRSRSSVANSLRLLGLDSQVRGMLERGQISTGHAKVLLGVENVGLIQRLAARVVREDLSVRQLERLKLSPRVPRGTLKRIDPEIVRLEEELQRSLE